MNSKAHPSTLASVPIQALNGFYREADSLLQTERILARDTTIIHHWISDADIIVQGTTVLLLPPQQGSSRMTFFYPPRQSKDDPPRQSKDEPY